MAAVYRRDPDEGQTAGYYLRIRYDDALEDQDVKRIKDRETTLDKVESINES